VTDLVLLALLAGLVWYVWDAVRAKEIARRACKEVCAGAEVQLLDDTVALRRMGLGRDARGALRLRRRYGFEFTRLGERRYRGWVTLLGTVVDNVEMEPHRF
jgi:hypothetical protein